jgi:hypothetical protein
MRNKIYAALVVINISLGAMERPEVKEMEVDDEYTQKGEALDVRWYANEIYTLYKQQKESLAMQNNDQSSSGQRWQTAKELLQCCYSCSEATGFFAIVYGLEFVAFDVLLYLGMHAYAHYPASTELLLAESAISAGIVLGQSAHITWRNWNRPLKTKQD